MLDAALHSIETGKLDEARDVLSSALDRQRGTIRELRDLSFALEPVVLRDQGFGPALEALAEHVGTSNRIRIDLDVGDSERVGATAQVALYTIVRELLDQAVRRGPLTRIEVEMRALDGGGHRDSRGRRRGARAAAAVARGDRGAREAAPRLDPRRRGGARDARRGDASALRDPAVGSRSMDGEGYLLMVWSPAGYTLREMPGNPPSPGHEFEDGERTLVDEQDRRLPAPRRQPRLRLLGRQVLRVSDTGGVRHLYAAASSAAARPRTSACARPLA